jgi:hypothetical protein
VCVRVRARVDILCDLLAGGSRRVEAFSSGIVESIIEIFSAIPKSSRSFALSRTNSFAHATK